MLLVCHVAQPHSKNGFLLQPLFKDWRILLYCSISISFMDTPRIPKGWLFSTTFRGRCMSYLPPHCPWGVCIIWCLPQKAHFSGSLKALTSKALTELLDINFVIMSLPGSTSVFQLLQYIPWGWPFHLHKLHLRIMSNARCVDVKRKKKETTRLKCVFPTLPKPKDMWRKSHFLPQPHCMEHFIPQKTICWRGTLVWKKSAITEIHSQL